MQRRLSLTLLTLTLFLTGCAFFKGREPLPAFFPDNIELVDKRITHQVIWKSGETTETFIAVLETHTDAVQLVGITPTGMSLFSLSQTHENQLLETSMLFPALIKPAALLTYLQLMNYPRAAITAELPDEWTLDNNQDHRALRFEGKEQVKLDWLTHSPLNAAIHTDKNTTISITQLSIEDAK